mmetsp:Transcript_21473/g.61543  ORF Transcript_21473/g.61543 Transcript_21473/m.61543 type:complete len:675 (+) Transcript_21473:273-2297(+)
MHKHHPYYIALLLQAIPVLDREYLRTGAASSSSTGIVRFLGFVQDQQDPEYYQTKVKGRNTKYRDYVYDGDQEGADSDADFDPMMMGGDIELAERQPLVVVPLPFTSEWFRQGLLSGHNAKEGNSGDETMVQEENGNANSNKRSRDEEEGQEAEASGNMQIEVPGDGVTEAGERVSSPARNRAKSDAKSPNCVASTPNALDWWPAGTMGSDESQIAVLAKVYYDDDEAEGDRLRLNDLVEMVGVVRFDPMEADFGSQQKQKDAKGDSCGNAGCSGMLADELGGFDDLSLLDRGALPPPSLLPRLHVLCYNRVDLDNAARKVVLEGTAIDEDASSGETDDRTFAIDALAHHLFAGKKEAGEALLLTLMSMAERESSANSSPGRPMTTPDGYTLGCASLNITLPTASACQSLKARLDATLLQIIPVVASADLSLGALAGGGSPSASVEGMAISSPAKTSEGRLAPSLMQLPKGAALLINQGSLGEGRVDEHGHRTLIALSGLTKNHTVPYRFGGLMDYQFEGDYRVIVVSLGSRKTSRGANARGEKNKLLGCTMEMKLSSPEYDADSVHALPAETAKRVRSFICRARGAKNNAKNIVLSRAILSQAEKDFVDRRVANRSSNNSINAAEIGEEDFHRWLNVTRLQARSRGVDSTTSTEACLGDWEAALTLDDKMKAP